MTLNFDIVIVGEEKDGKSTWTRSSIDANILFVQLASFYWVYLQSSNLLLHISLHKKLVLGYEDLNGIQSSKWECEK